MTTETPDYMQTYDDRWKSIVENPDGTLNLDAVARELADYDMLTDRVTEVYLAVTAERIGGPGARAQAVIDMVNDRITAAVIESETELVSEAFAAVRALENRPYSKAEIVDILRVVAGGCSCCWAPDAFEPLDADRCIKCGHKPEDHGWTRE